MLCSHEYSSSTLRWLVLRRVSSILSRRVSWRVSWLGDALSRIRDQASRPGGNESLLPMEGPGALGGALAGAALSRLPEPGADAADGDVSVRRGEGASTSAGEAVVGDEYDGASSEPGLETAAGCRGVDVVSDGDVASLSVTGRAPGGGASPAADSAGRAQLQVQMTRIRSWDHLILATDAYC